MTVSATPEKAKTEGDEIDDASITALVKMTLLSHRSTGAPNTKVETTDSEVTLSGKAGNAAEKDLATQTRRGRSRCEGCKEQDDHRVVRV